MRSFIRIAALTLSLTVPSSWALSVEGVNVPESITVADTPLVLNGAGLRKKFFFKIYIGALYLPAKLTSVEEILAAEGAKSVRMHFLYEELDAEKLTDAWTEGFKNNNSEPEFKALSARLDQFNAFFRTVKRGETIFVDLLPNGESRVVINDEAKGSVAGKDFQLALLKVWLGDKPADSGLKQSMLGAEE